MKLSTLIALLLFPAWSFAQTSNCQGLLYLSHNTYSPATDPSPLSIKTIHCQDGRYGIQIFNSAGEHIFSLKDEALVPAGVYTWTWDGKNKSGEPVASGIYIIRFSEAYGSHTGKVMVLR